MHVCFNADARPGQTQIPNTKMAPTVRLLAPRLPEVFLCGIRNDRHAAAVEVMSDISCPWCAQTFELAVDTSAETQQFVTDCEICCRPMTVFAECAPGEILSLDVQSE